MYFDEKYITLPVNFKHNVMKAVKISNKRTGLKSIYAGFKSERHAENYKRHLVLPEECCLEVIDVPESAAPVITSGFRYFE